MTLKTENNLGLSADDAYAALLHAHEPLTPEQGARLNARLVLILMNHVGDLAVIRQAVDLACANLDSSDNSTSP